MLKFTQFISLLSFLLVLTAQSYAQQQSSFGAFYALPVGKFKSTDIEDGGFAKPGWGLVFDSKYQLPIKNLGVNFHSTYQWNKMDNEKLSEVFTEELGYRTEISESRYSPLLMTVGPAYDVSLTDKILLGLNAGAGIIFNNTKAFTVKSFDEEGNQIINELVNFENNVAFAYMFGVDVNFQVIPDLLSISLYCDYTGANQKTEASLSSAATVDSFQKLQYLNLGFQIITSKNK